MKIVLEHLTKRYPNRNKKIGGFISAVDDFNFEIPDGQLIGLLGPSGCGKSTTLNMICGLETPTEGKIYFGDDDVTELPPEKRGVGMVFQSYALYPHLTVRQNIMFPLENLKGAQKLSKEEMEKRVQEAAEMVQIERLMDNKPSEMSGGQQQRVAIARAVVTKPGLILADEPTGNLDSKNGRDVMNTLSELNKQGTTVVMVTHSHKDALYANRIINLFDGLVVDSLEDRM